MSTHVEASTEDLWAVVADIESWPDALESMNSVRITSDGAFGEGSTARLQQPSMPDLTWTVTSWRPESSFDWQTRFAGTTILATHRVEPDGSGSRLTLGVQQTGLTAPLMALLGGRRNRRYVGIELEGTKRAAEERARTQ